jgi:hypothetical protein
MPDVIGREGQEPPPSMCCRDVVVPCAITNASTFPLEMTSDPLVQIQESSCVMRKNLIGRRYEGFQICPSLL